MSPPLPLSVRDLSTAIRSEAQRLGFSLVGITPAVTPAGFPRLVEWIAQGYHGEMTYIPRREEAYADPGRVLTGARSVIALGMNYEGTLGDGTRGDGTPGAEPDGPSPGGVPAQVARYARGSRDYHDLIRERLAELVATIRRLAPGAKGRGVVDTAPVLERDFARQAGLGWFGKNTLLIHKQRGSWLFLAAVLVDVELEYDAAHTASHCGTCTRCLEACPTQAFVEPYVLDARKCISYLTIELRGAIDRDLRAGMGDWLFGCDVCQEVCPWNRKAPATAERAFEPVAGLNPADALGVLRLTEEEFRARFAGTALERPGWSGLRRNAAIVLGNSGQRGGVAALARLRHDADPVVRGAAAWAIGRLGGEEARTVLRKWSDEEPNEAVREELAAALCEAERECEL